MDQKPSFVVELANEMHNTRGFLAAIRYDLERLERALEGF